MSGGGRPVRALAIGPRQHPGERGGVAIGGTRVLFEETLRQLAGRGFELDVIDTSRPRQNIPVWSIRLHELRAFARVLWGVLTRVRGSDVVFLNISSRAAWAVATAIWLACALARTPLALRFFGGSLHRTYARYDPLRRWLAHGTWLRSPAVYVETRQLCREFGARERFRWLPNTRDLNGAAAAAPPSEGVRRLVMIGQLRMDKGLREALEAARRLPDGCVLEVFGPQMPDTDFMPFAGHPRAMYCGVLDPAEVPGVLARQDLLLFPSYYEHDGVPGIIIEAFQCGVPVVATPLNGVPDIVEDGENGLFVEPRSSEDLREAILRLIGDPELYGRLREGARRRGEDFRSARWYDALARDLGALAAGAPLAPAADRA